MRHPEKSTLFVYATVREALDDKSDLAEES